MNMNFFFKSLGPLFLYERKCCMTIYRIYLKYIDQLHKGGFSDQYFRILKFCCCFFALLLLYLTLCMIWRLYMAYVYIS